MTNANPETGTPSPEAQRVGQALKNAVDKELEKKRKLGHYYAWVTKDGTELIGPDAPQEGQAD